MERGEVAEEEEDEEEVVTQLGRAIVSMTCSSLLLSLCRRACSSRSRADRIWRRRPHQENKTDN